MVGLAFERLPQPVLDFGGERAQLPPRFSGQGLVQILLETKRKRTSIFGVYRIEILQTPGWRLEPS